MYKSTDSGDTWAQVTGNGGGFGAGMVFWKGNLIVARTSGLDALRSPYTSSDWTTSFTAIESDVQHHPMIVGQDDIVYGGSGKFLFSLQEVSGTTFTAGTASTYTFNSQALDLPQDYRIKCLSELGQNLMLGTIRGISTVDDTFSNLSGDIFPWDRTNDTFELPIKLEEVGIHQLLTDDNIVYISAGVKGNYYITDGVNVRKIATIPDSILSTDNTRYLKNRPGAISKFQNEILLGIGGSTFGIGGQGIWSYTRAGKDEVVYLKNIISNEQDGSGTANVEIGAIQPIGRGSYLVGWAYGWAAAGGGVTYGIDKISTTRYTDYQTFFESQYIPLGSTSHPVPLAEIYFKLVKTLQTGQGVRLKYRLDLDDEFTTIDTYDFATLGAINEYTDTFGVTAVGGVQIRGELTTASGTTTTPELREIRIR